MKVAKKYFLFFLGFTILLSGCSKKAPTLMPAEKALRIAANTAEVKALLSYRQGALVSCLNVKIARSCDSEWVTCRDNAWVVQYMLSSKCPVQSDGRLGMNFVIDGMTGHVISHYPEVEYFADPYFCRDPADCVGVTVDKKSGCSNFIAAPFAHFTTSDVCQCSSGRCILKGER